MTDHTPPVTNSTGENQLRSQIKKRLTIQQGEISNVSFWISQIFMLVATVLGVYLAGQQGLRQAVAFEQIQSDKNNYYLRKSLQDELTDNLELIKEYTKSLKGISVHNARNIELPLDTFVWESMKYSSATLETPSVLLSESRQFYRKVRDAHKKIQSSYYALEYGSKQLLEVVEHMENHVLPQFETDTKTLQDVLKKKGVSL
ncbi:hypothetical protein QE250_07705 [Chromatiaceae bacterium AAb-1]|nr:hypothetical protein [Chromatiaceae bacterium AAb-1]